MSYIYVGESGFQRSDVIIAIDIEMPGTKSSKRTHGKQKKRKRK